MEPAAPATSDLEAQVIEFTGCSLTVARAAIEAAGPAGLERAVNLALSGECTQGTPQSAGPHKAVCLVRRDLNMGPGKVAAQVAHAVLGVYRLAQDRCPAVLQAQRRPAHLHPRLRPRPDPRSRAYPHSLSRSPSLAELGGRRRGDHSSRRRLSRANEEPAVRGGAKRPLHALRGRCRPHGGGARNRDGRLHRPSASAEYRRGDWPPRPDVIHCVSLCVLRKCAGHHSECHSIKYAL
jgi:hypothetical protein